MEHPDDREKWVPWSAGKCWTPNLGVGAADTKQGQVGEEKASRRQGASKTLREREFVDAVDDTKAGLIQGELERRKRRGERPLRRQWQASHEVPVIPYHPGAGLDPS